MAPVERIVPDEVFVGTRLLPVARIVAHSPGQHPDSPIRDDVYAVELVTAERSRWFGASSAWIGSDLRMHVLVEEGSRASAWPTP